MERYIGCICKHTTTGLMMDPGCAIHGVMPVEKVDLTPKPWGTLTYRPPTREEQREYLVKALTLDLLVMRNPHTCAEVFNHDETRKALEDARKLVTRVELLMLDEAIERERARIAAKQETP